jgi:hypothetical protein
MGIDPKSAAWKAASTVKVGTINDDQTLAMLIEMEVESALDEDRDKQYDAKNRIEVTHQVTSAAGAFDRAVEHVLTEWCKKNVDALNFGKGPLSHAKTAEDVVEVMSTLRGGAGYLYYMEHEGHGVGTWDGDWDVLFKDPHDTIKALSKHVLQATTQPYNKLHDAIDNAAYEAVGEDGTGKEARTRTAGLLAQDQIALVRVYADAWDPHKIVALWDELGLQYELRKLQYRSGKWTNPASWGKIMKVVCPGYNEFSAAGTASWLGRFKGISVQAAREYSVCVYIKGDPEVLQQMAADAKAAVKASEVNIQEDGTLRLWWD